MSAEAPSFSILAGNAEGPVVATSVPLSFWGGVSPEDGRVVDVHHPLYGTCLAGAVLLMPSSRGSCSGSGVLLDLVLSDLAPAAIIFSGAEDVLTLGALVGAIMFARPIPVVRVPPAILEKLSNGGSLRITPASIESDDLTVVLAPPLDSQLDLTEGDRAMLRGEAGPAVQQAMQIMCAMAVQEGARTLVDVTQVHVDGCIYASPANLVFAQRMSEMGAQVRVPTTMNAISVDYAHWRSQNVPISLGAPAAQLAEAYVRMGCSPTYTCSPYLLPSVPGFGEVIAWAESNAVIFANSVLGARTPKHPDFFDLCIALTGRAPFSGVYLDSNRRAEIIIEVAFLSRSTTSSGPSSATWPGSLLQTAYPSCEVLPQRSPRRMI